MFSSQGTFTNTFLHIQDFAQNASVVDGRLGFGIYLDGSGYSLGGTFIGTEDEFNQKVSLALLVSVPIALGNQLVLVNTGPHPPPPNMLFY